ncbi:MAG: hypothetical protein ACRD2I_20870 [Vicinamibacterales bacterium]
MPDRTRVTACTTGPIREFANHEGNNGLRNIGSRARDEQDDC